MSDRYAVTVEFEDPDDRPKKEFLLAVGAGLGDDYIDASEPDGSEVAVAGDLDRLAEELTRRADATSHLDTAHALRVAKTRLREAQREVKNVA